MKQRYRKPTGIPEQFIEATRHGWVDIRTGEVLESIPNLVERLADYNKYMDELHERQAQAEADDGTPYVVSNFEVHAKSESQKLQSEQEYQAYNDRVQDVVKTETIKDVPVKDVAKEKGTNKTTNRTRARAASKVTTDGTKTAASTIVIK